MFQIDKDTRICISISAKPSNFGCTIHNAAFRYLGLNYIYKAFGITDLKNVITGIRALGIRGCGVSMPFKQQVIQYLDKIDPIAQKIGAVNTIVNDNGVLTGYNTDYFGALEAIKLYYNPTGKSVLLLGAGGAGRAIAFALSELGFSEIFISNRTKEKAENLAEAINAKVVSWKEHSTVSAHLLINGTSIGMQPDIDSLPINEEQIDKFEAVLDVIVLPMKSKLICLAEEKGKISIPGYKMSLYQAAKQFLYYTKKEPPIEIMEESITRNVSDPFGLKQKFFCYDF